MLQNVTDYTALVGKGQTTALMHRTGTVSDHV